MKRTVPTLMVLTSALMLMPMASHAGKGGGFGGVSSVKPHFNGAANPPSKPPNNGGGSSTLGPLKPPKPELKPKPPKLTPSGGLFASSPVPPKPPLVPKLSPIFNKQAKTLLPIFNKNGKK